MFRKDFYKLEVQQKIKLMPRILSNLVKYDKSKVVKFEFTRKFKILGTLRES